MVIGNSEQIDVIIGVVDRPLETRATLEALFEANNNVNVILVDDGSTEQVDLYGLPVITTIFTGGRVGQAKSVNIGLDASTSEYVVVMHNDIVIKDKNWILKAIDFLKNNPSAGLVTDLGWVLANGHLPYIAISTTKEGPYCYSQVPMTEDFVEVYNADNIISVFANDGLRADERYGLGSYSLWIDLKAKGLKVYVMKFEDSVHSKSSTRYIPAYTNITTWKEECKLMTDVVLERMIEFGITMPKPEIKE